MRELKLQFSRGLENKGTFPFKFGGEMKDRNCPFLFNSFISTCASLYAQDLDKRTWTVGQEQISVSLLAEDHVHDFADRFTYEYTILWKIKAVVSRVFRATCSSPVPALRSLPVQEVFRITHWSVLPRRARPYRSSTRTWPQDFDQVRRTQGSSYLSLEPPVVTYSPRVIANF